MDLSFKRSGSTEPIHRRRRLARAACSALILTCLGIQALVVVRVFHPPRALAELAFLRRLPAPSLWPFIDYPMFSEAHVVGERVERVYLVIEWETGEVEPHYPEQRRGGFDVEAMIRECRAGQEDAAMQRLARFEGQRSARANRVCVERVWLQLEREGFVPGVPECLMTLANPDQVVGR